MDNFDIVTDLSAYIQNKFTENDKLDELTLNIDLFAEERKYFLTKSDLKSTVYLIKNELKPLGFSVKKKDKYFILIDKKEKGFISKLFRN